MNETHMHHGKHWRGATCRGWLASEKYRGARAYWDGSRMWARGGLSIALPPDWLAALPLGFALDGEIWAGRGPAGGTEEVEAAAAVTHGRFTDRLRFMVFDAPGQPGGWAQRMRVAAAQLKPGTPIIPVGFMPLRTLRQLEKLFGEVKARGGEGLILRHPQAPYEVGRTGNTRKVKVDPALARGIVRFAA